MRQITHVAKHAAILSHGLFGSIVGVILGMRTDSSQDASDNRLWESFGEIATRDRDRTNIIGIAVGFYLEIIVGFGSISRVALGASSEAAEEAHNEEQASERRENKQTKKEES